MENVTLLQEHAQASGKSDATVDVLMVEQKPVEQRPAEQRARFNEELEIVFLSLEESWILLVAVKQIDDQIS